MVFSFAGCRCVGPSGQPSPSTHRQTLAAFCANLSEGQGKATWENSMKTTIAVGMLAASLAAQGPDVVELIRKDKERLQGTWKVIAAESKGEKVPTKELGDLRLI